jgi:probable aminopeptidase NPEPL1
MVVIEYRPSAKAKKKKPHIMLVGKGVMYDTGGLNLKISGSMPGMKSDMGGSAAVVEAAYLLASSGCTRPITAIVGLVENAIGRDAYRPDDILSMHSGLTVEINNTDAEGRLVLADAMSYGYDTYKPDLAIEAATLTGAQMVATGVKHAAVMSNSHDLERFAVDTGKLTGDLLYALPFGPEFHAREFKSEVADMKNSVKSRMNASSSCAAYFVYAHIQGKAGDWLHIDIAGPSFIGERGTGFGVHALSRLSQNYKPD